MLVAFENLTRILLKRLFPVNFLSKRFIPTSFWRVISRSETIQRGTTGKGLTFDFLDKFLFVLNGNKEWLSFVNFFDGCLSVKMTRHTKYFDKKKESKRAIERERKRESQRGSTRERARKKKRERARKKERERARKKEREKAK